LAAWRRFELFRVDLDYFSRPADLPAPSWTSQLELGGGPARIALPHLLAFCARLDGLRLTDATIDGAQLTVLFDGNDGRSSRVRINERAGVDDFVLRLYPERFATPVRLSVGGGIPLRTQQPRSVWRTAMSQVCRAVCLDGVGLLQTLPDMDFASDVLETIVRVEELIRVEKS
jgi:hypothetical protein